MEKPVRGRLGRNFSFESVVLGLPFYQSILVVGFWDRSLDETRGHGTLSSNDVDEHLTQSELWFFSGKLIMKCNTPFTFVLLRFSGKVVPGIVGYDGGETGV